MDYFNDVITTFLGQNISICALKMNEGLTGLGELSLSVAYKSKLPIVYEMSTQEVE